MDGEAHRQNGGGHKDADSGSLRDDCTHTAYGLADELHEDRDRQEDAKLAGHILVAGDEVHQHTEEDCHKGLQEKALETRH